MTAQRLVWSFLVGLAVVAIVLVAAAPAVAEESGKVRIQGTSIAAKLSLMAKTDLTGSFNTGCLNLSPAPTQGQIVPVDVASPGIISGWDPPERYTFILSATSGKQRLCQYASGMDPRALVVTVTEDPSCDGLHTWVITFLEEPAAVVTY